jgi:hypothetical protein
MSRVWTQTQNQNQINLLHNKNSEFMDVRSFNVTPVLHFVKAEPREKKFFLTKKVSVYLNVFRRKKKVF